MFTDILEVNDYSIIVSIAPIIPPMTAGKFEAKVTKIYDQLEDTDVQLSPENTCIAWGHTEAEAYTKSQDRVKSWALKQR